MIQAVGDMVIVEPVLKKTVGVIHIPDSAQRKLSEFAGVVVSVGPEYPYEIKAGDKVLYRENEGVPVESQGKNLLVLKSEWVVGRFDD